MVGALNRASVFVSACFTLFSRVGSTTAGGRPEPHVGPGLVVTDVVPHADYDWSSHANLAFVLISTSDVCKKAFEHTLEV